MDEDVQRQLEQIVAEATDGIRRYNQEYTDRQIKEAIATTERRALTEREYWLREARKGWEKEVWDRMPQLASREYTPKGHKHSPSPTAGTDCMPDYLISECWDGPEGQVFQSLTGCDFRVYSTIGGAMTHAAALASNEHRVFFICGGTYIEEVTAAPPNAASWDVFGAGQGNTIWQADANGQFLWTISGMSSGSRVGIQGINFDLVGFTGCGGLVNTSNFRGFVRDCHFDTGGSTTSHGIDIINTIGLSILECGFTGSGIGIDSSLIQLTTVMDCVFDCDIGINITGNRSSIIGNQFGCSTTGIDLGTSGEISITGNYFTAASTDRCIDASGAPTDNLLINGNTFRLSSSATGIYCDPTVNSEAWTISANTFNGSTSTIGIRLDAQMMSGIIALNTFQDFTSGNEITGSAGASFQIFHNTSSDGSSGTNQPLADAGSPVGHSTTAVAAPSDAQYLTLATHASLSAERVFTPRYNIFATDAGANGAYSVDSWLEGAQITPSAGTLTLGTDGDMFHVAAGNFSAIDTPTRQTLVLLIFDGVSVVTHNGTSLILQGATNFTSAAGDTMMLAWEGSGANWREINRHTAAAAAAGGGHTIQEESSDVAVARTYLDFRGTYQQAVDDGVDATAVFGGYAHYDAIVDNGQYNALATTVPVYTTLQAAITAGHTSILFRSSTDGVAITSTGSAQYILGDTLAGAAIPVNLTVDNSCLLSNLNFTNVALTLSGTGATAQACMFSGTATVTATGSGASLIACAGVSLSAATAITLNGNENRVQACRFSLGSTTTTVIDCASSSLRSSIVGNVWQGSTETGYFLVVNGSGTLASINGNVFNMPSTATGVADLNLMCNFTGNTVNIPAISSGTTKTIIEDAQRCIVSGNIFQVGNISLSSTVKVIRGGTAVSGCIAANNVFVCANVPSGSTLVCVENISGGMSVLNNLFVGLAAPGGTSLFLNATSQAYSMQGNMWGSTAATPNILRTFPVGNTAGTSAVSGLSIIKGNASGFVDFQMYRYA